MVCLVVLIVAGLVALPRLRDLGFFGAVRTQSPDVEISKKQGNLGIRLNLPPSLEADIDSLYSGRASSSAAAGGPRPGQDLLDYFSSQVRTAGQIIARNLDSGQSITNQTKQTEPIVVKIGVDS